MAATFLRTVRIFLSSVTATNSRSWIATVFSENFGLSLTEDDVTVVDVQQTSSLFSDPPHYGGDRRCAAVLDVLLPSSKKVRDVLQKIIQIEDRWERQIEVVPSNPSLEEGCTIEGASEVGAELQQQQLVDVEECRGYLYLGTLRFLVQGCLCHSEDDPVEVGSNTEECKKRSRSGSLHKPPVGSSSLYSNSASAPKKKEFTLARVTFSPSSSSLSSSAERTSSTFQCASKYITPLIIYQIFRSVTMLRRIKVIPYSEQYCNSVRAIVQFDTSDVYDSAVKNIAQTTVSLHGSRCDDCPSHHEICFFIKDIVALDDSKGEGGNKKELVIRANTSHHLSLTPANIHLLGPTFDCRWSNHHSHSQQEVVRQDSTHHSMDYTSQYHGITSTRIPVVVGTKSVIVRAPIQVHAMASIVQPNTEVPADLPPPEMTPSTSNKAHPTVSTGSRRYTAPHFSSEGNTPQPYQDVVASPSPMDTLIVPQHDRIVYSMARWPGDDLRAVWDPSAAQYYYVFTDLATSRLLTSWQPPPPY